MCRVQEKKCSKLNNDAEKCKVGASQTAARDFNRSMYSTL